MLDFEKIASIISPLCGTIRLYGYRFFGKSMLTYILPAITIKEFHMSNQQQKKIIGGRDLINIGIFTAIIFIITMAVMPIGFIPVLMPLYCVIIPVVGGIPWMLFATKVKKLGMVFIMSMLLGLLLMLSGMGWYALPVCAVSGIITELILKLGAYKSKKHTVIAHGVFCTWLFGSYIPLIFMADTYWQQNADYGEEFISSAKSIFQIWTAPVLIALCVAFGILGGLLGLKKHFAKAGIV